MSRDRKFTPGPWKVDEFQANTIWGPDNEHIADIRGYGSGLPQESNAHLIASAPSMYAALKDLLRVSDYCDGLDDDASREFTAAVSSARAALSKAEGKGDEHE